MDPKLVKFFFLPTECHPCSTCFPSLLARSQTLCDATWVRFLSLLTGPPLETWNRSLISSSYPQTCFNLDLSPLWQSLALPSLSILLSLFTFTLLNYQILFFFSQKINSWWCDCEWWPDIGTSNEERHQLAKYKEGVSSCKAVRRMSPSRDFLTGWLSATLGLGTWRSGKDPGLHQLRVLRSGEVCMFLLSDT